MIPKKWKIKFENKIIDQFIFRQSLSAFHPVLYIILQKRIIYYNYIILYYYYYYNYIIL